MVVDLVCGPVVGFDWGKVLHSERRGANMQAALPPCQMSACQDHRNDREARLQRHVDKTLQGREKRTDVCFITKMMWMNHRVEIEMYLFEREQSSILGPGALRKNDQGQVILDNCTSRLSIKENIILGTETTLTLINMEEEK